MMGTASPLLETKLYIPPRRRGMVPRARLIERLNGGAAGKLTLVSAPAGFGKTTLLAEWLAAAPDDSRSTAWLSLDASDNDPASFWTYLIAALQTVAPGVGVDALALLQSPRPPPIATILATVLNGLSAIPHDVLLVLDDFHTVDAHDVQAGVSFLLDHLPPRVHLVMASRADPTLPLARLRARGELVEVRAADLRFTPDEAAAYLNEVMGLNLSALDVAALEGRTEGWIAALQLAALSMQGRADVTDFIASFAGDDRYIVDYLVGKAMLEMLERGNLFVVPLDDRRRWYRFHHLFADVLRTRLLDEQSGQVPALHGRASTWYERNGERSEAISHALAAADFPRAAQLVEAAVPSLRRNRQEATVAGLASGPAGGAGHGQAGAQRHLCLGITGVRRAGGR